MPTIPQAPSRLTPELLNQAITLAKAQYVVALILIWGMVFVMLGIIALALGWRKTGFFFTALYGGLMMFLGIGYSGAIGIIIVVASVGGILREWLAVPVKA